MLSWLSLLFESYCYCCSCRMCLLGTVTAAKLRHELDQGCFQRARFQWRWHRYAARVRKPAVTRQQSARASVLSSWRVSKNRNKPCKAYIIANPGHSSDSLRNHEAVIAYFNTLKLDVSDAKTLFRLLDSPSTSFECGHRRKN